MRSASLLELSLDPLSLDQVYGKLVDEPPVLGQPIFGQGLAAPRLREEVAVIAWLPQKAQLGAKVVETVPIKKDVDDFR